MFNNGTLPCLVLSTGAGGGCHVAREVVVHPCSKNVVKRVWFSPLGVLEDLFKKGVLNQQNRTLGYLNCMTMFRDT